MAKKAKIESIWDDPVTLKGIQRVKGLGRKSTPRSASGISDFVASSSSLAASRLKIDMDDYLKAKSPVPHAAYASPHVGYGLHISTYPNSSIEQSFHNYVQISGGGGRAINLSFFRDRDERFAVVRFIHQGSLSIGEYIESLQHQGRHYSYVDPDSHSDMDDALNDFIFSIDAFKDNPPVKRPNIYCRLFDNSLVVIHSDIRVR